MARQGLREGGERTDDTEAHGAVSRSERRVDGLGKVLGVTDLTGDLAFPGLTHGKLVRSAVPLAAVASVDVAAALEVEGVLDVVTPSDVPGETTHTWVRKHPPPTRVVL